MSFTVLCSLIIATFCAFGVATADTVFSFSLNVVATSINLLLAYTTFKRNAQSCEIENPEILGLGYIKGGFLHSTGADDPQHTDPLMIIGESNVSGKVIAVSRSRAYVCIISWGKGNSGRSIYDMLVQCSVDGTLPPLYKIQSRLWHIPKHLKDTIQRLLAG